MSVLCLRGFRAKMASKTLIVSITCVLYIFVLSSAADLPTCQPSDFHWEYTECDSQGSRWRVQVPTAGVCEGGAPKPPVRGVKCDQMCARGEYLDVQGAQDCQKCPVGTYSLGGGVRYEDWDGLPSGFHTEQEYMGSLFSEITGIGSEDNSSSCEGEGWKAVGKELFVLPSDCASSVVLTTSLVTHGKVKFVYQYEDSGAILHFKVQNSECSTRGYDQIDRRNKFPQATEPGEWQTVEEILPAGPTKLIWKVMGFGSHTTNTFSKPVRIRSIEVTGVAFTQECTKCPAGTYSGPGASQCEQCPENAYSERGAGECRPCNSVTQYSPPGSAKCLERPPCTEREYFKYHTPCDKNNKTQIQYRWIPGRVCRDDLSGSVKLPEPTEPVACPPCNPGMEMGEDGVCKFCSDGLFSDGSTPCGVCPASTAPEYAFKIGFWNSLPVDANISSNCLGFKDGCCATETGWILATDNIQTMASHCDDAFLVFSLELSGFRGQEQYIGGSAVAVAELTFVFETSCSADCSLTFFQQAESEDVKAMESWKDSQDKQSYTFKIKSTEARLFSWVFQKKNEGVVGNEFTLSDDFARVYSVHVTNTVGGGAVSCKQCPKGSNTEGCVPCPKNNYIEVNTTECKQCPPGTVLHSGSPWGKEACHACGEGLTPSRSDEADKCVTSCKYISRRGREYDFTGLSGYVEVLGDKQFTSSGTQFFHLFNISLCGGGFHFPEVTCADNVTNRLGDTPSVVQSAICRSTIIPPKEGDIEEIISAQPTSIGDVLVRVTTDGESLNMSRRMSDEGFAPPDPSLGVEDVHFVYRSETPTTACGDGRSTVVTLRCDVFHQGVGAVTLPPKCRDATCDGCHMHFLWLSSEACPKCSDDVYSEIKGACVKGEQKIHYIAPKYCPEKEATHATKCSVLPMWLEITIASMCAVGILLCVLVIYCWNRNKTLEYKYMKLVTTSDGKEGELPAAETCALDDDDDEEDEHFDAVRFQESKSGNFFSKIKSMGQRKGDNPFENISMSDREPLT